jgi:hypothetical protein
MENNSENTFPGQQDGEKIISVITPHQFAFTLEYVKLICISLFLLIGFVSLQRISPVFILIGIVLSISTLVIGFWLYRSIHAKRITYITNYRLVRFEPSNAFVVNTRSLTWDNVIKVKTLPTNIIWRIKNLGTVIVHSKNTSANDDIVLKDIHYYKDLGNYIDKILYLYAHDPKELDRVHPFVDKPKGQRY